MTALNIAYVKGHIKIVELLLACERFTALNTTDEVGKMALLYCLE
jgi:hypothetical protein